MTILSRPIYGEPIGRIDERGRVILLDSFEKFLDDLIGEIGATASGITQITNQQQLVEGGSGAGDDDEPEPLMPPVTVVQTTVQVINHLHMDCDGEDQPEPMFVPG